MDNLYVEISIVGAAAIYFAIGLCFVFMSVPKDKALHHYRMARYVLAGSYLIFGFLNVVEYLTRSVETQIQLVQLITLVVGSFQAYLFTYTFIALINLKLLTFKRLFVRLIPLTLFCAAGFFILPAARYFEVYFYILVAVYILLLASLTRLFLQNYKAYLLRMDNYYSDEEARRLQWVNLMFWGALGIGLLALLSALFMTKGGAIVFSVVYLVYYIYFAIRFLGYPHEFKEIEAAMSNEPQAKTGQEAKLPQGIEERLQQWMQEKRFLEQGITTSQLAACLGTNRETLSSYINQSYKTPFRAWINQLRIEESKQIMLADPALSIADVAAKVGIDKSNFSRHFTQATGQSPNQWLKSQSSK